MKKKVKKKGRRRSYGEKLKRRSSLPKELFSLFYSRDSPRRLGSHCLTVLAIACLGQPIKPSILEGLVTHPFV